MREAEDYEASVGHSIFEATYNPRFTRVANEIRALRRNLGLPPIELERMV